MKKILNKIWFLPFMLLPTKVLAGDSRIFYNPLTSTGSSPRADILPVSEIVGRFIFAFLIVAGIVAVINIVRAGLKIASAQGNSEQIDAGKRALMFSIIGLVVTFMGYIVVGLIITQFSRVVPGLGG